MGIAARARTSSGKGIHTPPPPSHKEFTQFNRIKLTGLWNNISSRLTADKGDWCLNTLSTEITKTVQKLIVLHQVFTINLQPVPRQDRVIRINGAYVYLIARFSCSSCYPPFSQKMHRVWQGRHQGQDQFGFSGSTSISAELALQKTAKQIYLSLSSFYQQRQKCYIFWSGFRNGRLMTADVSERQTTFWESHPHEYRLYPQSREIIVLIQLAGR